MGEQIRRQRQRFPNAVRELERENGFAHDRCDLFFLPQFPLVARDFTDIERAGRALIQSKARRPTALNKKHLMTSKDRIYRLVAASKVTIRSLLLACIAVRRLCGSGGGCRITRSVGSAVRPDLDRAAGRQFRGGPIQRETLR
jgi:hypothetical protein